jgi:uncharacterized protein with PIN domain
MAKREYETADYVAMMRRMTRGLGRRLADGDPADVASALDVSRELDRVIKESVRAMREAHGFSWAQIADELGMTRQAAQQRFGKGE